MLLVVFACTCFLLPLSCLSVLLLCLFEGVSSGEPFFEVSSVVGGIAFIGSLMSTDGAEGSGVVPFPAGVFLASAAGVLEPSAGAACVDGGVDAGS